MEEFVRQKQRKNRNRRLWVFIILYPKRSYGYGGVIFDIGLVKMKINIKNTENMWGKVIKLLNRECPKKTCER